MAKAYDHEQLILQNHAEGPTRNSPPEKPYKVFALAGLLGILSTTSFGAPFPQARILFLANAKEMVGKALPH